MAALRRRPLLRVEARIRNGQRPVARRVQPPNFRRDAGSAPVRELAVVLVPALDDRVRRVRLQVFLDQRVADGGPAGFASGRTGRAFRLTVAAGQPDA